MGRLLDVIAEDYTIVGTGRYKKTDEHDSLVIDTIKDVFYWNSKDIAGDLFDWYVKIKGLSKTEAQNLVYKTPHIAINVYKTERKKVVVNDGLVDAFFNLGKKNREYWYHRGYTDSTIDLFRLGFTGDWYVIPIFVEGKFRNFQCRKPDKTMKHWYGGVGPLPFNMDYVKDLPEWVLTEGPVDAIMCMQNGIPAMSTNTGAGYFRTRWISNFNSLERVYIVYDNDEAGVKGARKVGEIFGLRAKCYLFNDLRSGYDISDYFNEGGNSIEFMELLKSKGKYWFEL
jgi:DNA primase